MGGNTAVFTLVNTLFFAPPAYAKPHEMVQLFPQDKKDAKKFRGFSYPTYVVVREQNTVFTDVMCSNLALVGLGQKGDTRRVFSADQREIETHYIGEDRVLLADIDI